MKTNSLNNLFYNKRQKEKRQEKLENDSLKKAKWVKEQLQLVEKNKEKVKMKKEKKAKQNEEFKKLLTSSTSCDSIN